MNRLFPLWRFFHSGWCKSFVIFLMKTPGKRASSLRQICSKTPLVQIKMDQKRYRPGQVLDLRVSASQNTRTLVARLEGVAPVALRWDPKTGANTGQLFLPEQMIPGTYKLTVTAEDIAHNMGSQGVDIEIVP